LIPRELFVWTRIGVEEGVGGRLFLSAGGVGKLCGQHRDRERKREAAKGKKKTFFSLSQNLVLDEKRKRSSPPAQHAPLPFLLLPKVRFEKGSSISRVSRPRSGRKEDRSEFGERENGRRRNWHGEQDAKPSKLSTANWLSSLFWWAFPSPFSGFVAAFFPPRTRRIPKRSNFLHAAERLGGKGVQEQAPGGNGMVDFSGPNRSRFHSSSPGPPPSSPSPSLFPHSNGNTGSFLHLRRSRDQNKPWRGKLLVGNGFHTACIRDRSRKVLFLASLASKKKKEKPGGGALLRASPLPFCFLSCTPEPASSL